MTISYWPHFLTNKEWFYLDKKEGVYKLTDKATPEAVKSYKEFYKLLDSVNIT